MPVKISSAMMRSQDPAMMRAILKIAKAIQETKHALTPLHPHALLVGGFVRDALLKRRSKDADLEVYGVDAKNLERILRRLFPKRVTAVGKAFGVYQIRVKEKGSGVRAKQSKGSGRIAFNATHLQSPTLDVSIPRHESKTSKGHKGFSVTGDPSMEIEDAARRRDFTMNAMLMDPMTRELIDPFHGADDLKARTLRVVDPQTFVDDPLRVWRALQLAARFGLQTDPKTTALLRKMVKAGATDELPKERITEEMRKLLLFAARPSIGFELARTIGLIERDLPELHALVLCTQNAGSHREGSAWTHTMLVIDAMAKIIRDPKWKIAEDEKLPLMLAAVCHDLGKTRVPWRRAPGRELGYLHHAEAGGVPAAECLARFSFGSGTNAQVVTITINHRQGGVILERMERHDLDARGAANELRILLRTIRPTSWNAYLAMSVADMCGVTGWDARERIRTFVHTLDRIVKRFDLISAAEHTLVTGKDLVRLGVPEGTAIGRIIARIEEDRDAGRVTNRADALALAKILVSAIQQT